MIHYVYLHSVLCQPRRGHLHVSWPLYKCVGILFHRIQLTLSSISASMLDRRLTAWTPRVTGESFKIPPLPKVDNETIYDESLHDITDAHKSAAEEVQQIHRGVMTECYQWESDVSSSKYSTLLKLKHPHIIEIDDGEWSPSLCILRVTKPPQPRVISIHDLIMSEGALLISDAYQMSKNVRFCPDHPSFLY